MPADIPVFDSADVALSGQSRQGGTLMSGRVEVVCGDIFEGPSDLLVIPCSTGPTIAEFVRTRLSQFQIPAPTARMEPGEVRFVDLDGASQLAPCAAYAASVLNYASRPEWITAIGMKLGERARQHDSLRLIACPLLGTGAGHLRPESAFEALVKGFTSAAPDPAILRVFIPDHALYEQLHRLLLDRESETLATIVHATPTPNPPRVFISYTNSSPAHLEWVVGLATQLRANGVEARLDKWHLTLGTFLPQWMTNEIALADRVLLICDELYVQKADGLHGGVGWEIMLILGDLLNTKDRMPDKYVPVLVGTASDRPVPFFLQGANAISWPEDLSTDAAAGKERELLEAIYRVQSQPPPLGRPPSFVLARY
jgi:hypothetical protein